MTRIQHPFFGLIEINPPDATFWQGDVSVHGVSSKCSLFVDEGLANQPERLIEAFTWLEDLNALDGTARQAFLNNLAQSTTGTVGDFITFHLQELDASILERIFGTPEPASISPERFLSGLSLRGVGIHMDGPSDFTVNLDYGLPREHSDQLLVARWRNHGRVLDIAHES